MNPDSPQRALQNSGRSAKDESSRILAGRLRQAAFLLVLLYSSALLSSILPPSPRYAGWYLSANDRLIANAPIAITAACLWWLSARISPLPALKLKRPLSVWARFNPLSLLLLDPVHVTRFLGSVLFGIYILILPTELIAGSHQYFAIQTEHRATLRHLREQQTRIAEGLNTASTSAQLEALLAPGARQPPSLMPFDQRRQTLRVALGAEQAQLVQRLARSHRQSLSRLLIDMLRVILMALPTALFLKRLARTDDPVLKRVEIYKNET